MLGRPWAEIAARSVGLDTPVSMGSLACAHLVYTEANEEYKEGDKLSIDQIGKRVMNKEMLRVEVNRRDDPDTIV